MELSTKLQFFFSGGSPAPGRLYGLFFDGVNDFINRSPVANLRDREFRLVCTFPSITVNDQQVFNLSESTSNDVRFAATYYTTRLGTADFAVNAGTGGTGSSWSIASLASSVGEIQNIIMPMDANFLIQNATLNGNLLDNPADAISRWQAENHSYRLGVRPDGSFPYRGVIIEWRDGATVFNDGNDWGDFTINGAQRVYTDNPDAAKPSWFFASNDQPVTL